MVDITREKPVPVETIAELCSVTRRTVDSWRSRGLEWIKLGGRVYSSLEAMNRFAVHGPASVQQQPTQSNASELLESLYGV